MSPTPRRGRVLMQVRWSDVDLFAHVNNAAYLRYLDDARFALFPDMGVDRAGRPTDSMLVVVKHEIDYQVPLAFRPEPVAVEVWVPRIGGSSVDFAYEVADPEEAGGERRVYLRARSRMVQLDRVSLAPRPLTAGERENFERFPGAGPDLHPWGQ